MNRFHGIVLIAVVGLSGLALAQDSTPKDELAKERARIEKAIDELQKQAPKYPTQLGSPFHGVWTLGFDDSLQFGPGLLSEDIDEFTAQFPEELLEDFEITLDDFQFPLIQWRTDGSEGPATVRTTTRYEVNGESVEVESDNGELTVRINGEKVDDSRIRRSGDRVEILDEAGKVLHTFHVSPSLGIPQQLMEWRSLGSGGKRPSIGIQMEPVSEALAFHLDIEGREAVLVGAVSEGQAAEKAGLQRFDVIVGAEGRDGVTMQEIRSIVGEKKPGDVLELSVLRRGRPMTLRITVEESEFSFGETMNQSFFGNSNPFAPRYRGLQPGRYPTQRWLWPTPKTEGESEEVETHEASLRKIEERLERVERLLERLERAKDQRF